MIPAMSKKTFSAGGPVLLFAAGLLFLLTLALYFPTLHFPFLNLDDSIYVTQNPHIRRITLESLKAIFFKQYFMPYSPLSLLSLALDYQVWHLNPFGYRITALLLHAANSFFAFVLISQMTRSRLAALGAVLVFAVHPAQIESVVWISERKSLLAAFFYLPALICYWKEKRTAALGLFVLACLAKPNVVVMPLVLIAMDICFPRENKIRWPRYLPFFAVSFFAALITVLGHHEQGKSVYYGGSFWVTMRVMTLVMMRYFELVFLPLRQSLLYGFYPYASFFHPHVLISSAALAGIAAGVWGLWRREKVLFFFVFWYFTHLLPVLNFIPFPSLMNDRYLYLPLLGIFAALFVYVRRQWGAKAFVIAAAVFVLGYSGLNLRRQAVWGNSEKLWKEAQAETQGSYSSPHHNLGTQYLREKKYDLAIEELLKAVEIKGSPYAYSALGSAYLGKGDAETAVSYFKKAIELKPDEAGFHNNLALFYRAQKNDAGAFEEFELATQGPAPDALFLSNFGSFLMQARRAEEAEQKFLRALEINPDQPDALLNLGLLYLVMRKPGEARKYWSRLLEVQPDHPRAAQMRAQLEKAAANG